MRRRLADNGPEIWWGIRAGAYLVAAALAGYDIHHLIR